MSFRADELHPMRLLRAVPGSDLIVQQAVRRDPQGLLRSATLDAMTEKVMELYNGELERIPFEKRPPNLDVLTKTVSSLAHIANLPAPGAIRSSCRRS